MYFFNLSVLHTILSPLSIIFSSSLTHHRDDRGRLDGIQGGHRERCDDEAGADYPTDRNLRLHANDSGIHRDHCSSMFWLTVQAFDKSHGSRQTVTAAGVLLLWYRSEPTVRADVCSSSNDNFSGGCDLYLSGCLPWPHDFAHLWSIGELQISIS